MVCENCGTKTNSASCPECCFKVEQVVEIDTTGRLEMIEENPMMQHKTMGEDWDTEKLKEA